MLSRVYVRAQHTCYIHETKETDTVGTQVGKGEFPVESFEREDPLPTLRGEILNLSRAEKRNVTRIFLFELSRDPAGASRLTQCNTRVHSPTPSGTEEVRPHMDHRWHPLYVPDILFPSLWQLVRVPVDTIIDRDHDPADGYQARNCPQGAPEQKRGP